MGLKADEDEFGCTSGPKHPLFLRCCE